MLDAGEKCDPKIGSSCPTSCDDGKACTADKLEGNAAQCTATCTHTPITSVIDGDGCCPPDANPSIDKDCKASCGDGTVGAGEKCDPKSKTPCPSSCDDKDPCTKDKLEGSAADCTATCTHTPITSAADGDGCCPSNANPSSDADCKASCGDGVVSGEEKCDPNSSVPCPSSCDDSVSCTIDELSGSSANCTALCTHRPAEASLDNDECCPPGANANTDADCSPICGNGIEEIGEDCDYAAPGQELDITCDYGCWRIESREECASDEDCSEGVCSDGECTL